MKKHYNLSHPDWFDEHIEQFVDEELTRAEAAKFTSRLSIDRNLQDKVRRAEFVQMSLRSAPKVFCPESVTDSVLALARAESSRPEVDGADRIQSAKGTGTFGLKRLSRIAPIGRLNDRRSKVHVRSPFVSTTRRIQIAAIAAVLVTAIVLIPNKEVVNTNQFEQAEVDRALLEAKWALSLISDIGRDTGRSVRSDAVPTVSKAFGYILASEPSEVINE